MAKVIKKEVAFIGRGSRKYPWDQWLGVLKFGIAPLKFRISRKDDKYLVVKTSAGTATLRIWAKYAPPVPCSARLRTMVTSAGNLIIQFFLSE